ncbi:hypothetical protein [Methanobrevibacter sp.]|uniref:hypothetical protein n=1 Tax=Methanobrevibacter sp. TaxID=66852 RepID=UPI003890D81C
MISEKQALEIAQKIENANDIDIKKTIEKASTAGYLGEKHFYCTVIEEGGMTHTVPEILGDRYKSMELDNLYFDIISKALDHDGIYISLAYSSPYIQISPQYCDETYEYDEYEMDFNEIDVEDLYLMEYGLITSEETKTFKIYAEEGISGHERTEDVGIMVNILDGDYRAYFALRSTDLCMSSFKVLPFGADYPKEHPLSFKNPINRMLIEMIEKVIIKKE